MSDGREHDDPAVVVPSAGRKRDLESHSGSDSEPALASDSEALAIVPVTPDDVFGFFFGWESYSLHVQL